MLSKSSPFRCLGQQRTRHPTGGVDHEKPLADTPAFQSYRARGPKFVDSRVSVTPTKRIGDLLKDNGGAALFLVSDDTRYVTGQVAHVDGCGYLSSPVIEAVWDV